MKLLSMIFALLVGPLTGVLAQDFPVLPAVNAVVKPLVGQDAPGVAVLVMRDGQVLHMRGYGYSDLTTKAKIDIHTIFDLASVSKQMTGQAAMLLIQDGLLAVDTPIEDVLPAFAALPGDQRQLVVGDLIYHIAGLTDYLDGDESLDYGAKTSNDEVIDWLVTQELVRPPGTVFEYCNTCYLALASVVAAADGATSLRDVLQARIWDKLGMLETGLVTPAEGVAAAAMAKGYAGTHGHFEPSFEPTATEGDGNVLTSLYDLAMYETALATHELLDEDATAALFTTGVFDNGEPVVDEGGEAGYGFGWGIEQLAGSHYASHTGSWMGTSTAYQRNLDTGVTVIVLANGEDLNAGQLASDIEDAIDE